MSKDTQVSTCCGVGYYRLPNIACPLKVCAKCHKPFEARKEESAHNLTATPSCCGTCGKPESHNVEHVCDKDESITIVPSGRIDYCSTCKADHGYDCPNEWQSKEKEIVAFCNNCLSEFTVWLSDSNKCPECEGKVVVKSRTSPQPPTWQEEEREAFEKWLSDENTCPVKEWLSSDSYNAIAAYFSLRMEQRMSETETRTIRTVNEAFAKEIEKARKAEREKIRKMIENMTPPKDKIWGDEYKDGWEQGKQDIIRNLQD